MKTVVAALIAGFAITASPAMAQLGAIAKSDQQCNTWQNGKYVSQPSTSRNIDGSKRR